MKICLISNLYAPDRVGGAEVYVEKIAKYLAEKNEVFIITSKSYNGFKSLKYSIEYQDKVKIYRFYPLNFYWIYTAIQGKISSFLKIFWHLIDLWNFHSYLVVRKILKKEKPDIVYTHNLCGISTGAIFFAVKSLKIPLIHKVVDYFLICPYSTLKCLIGENCKFLKKPCQIYRGIKRVIINHKVDVLIGASQFILDIHTKNGFFEKAKKICLPNGIEIKNDLTEEEILEKFKNKTFHLLYVGQLSKHKGVEVLIKAVKEIKNENLKVDIVGGPIFYENYLKDLAGGDKRIVFHGKLLPKEVSKFYQQANLLVVPSVWYEPFGNVILEAFAYGVPVIASKIGGIPELIKPGYNGYLFEPGNSEELKTLLLKLIHHPEELKILAKNAFDLAKKYEISEQIEKLIKIFEDIKK
jgi:glycosyltransferase involved in cell wall biosynthesis